jgi:hypothetical protein
MHIIHVSKEVRLRRYETTVIRVDIRRRRELVTGIKEIRGTGVVALPLLREAHPTYLVGIDEIGGLLAPQMGFALRILPFGFGTVGQPHAVLGRERVFPDHAGYAVEGCIG